MRLAMYIVVFIAVIIFGLVMYSFTFKDIETPKYQVVKTFGKVEIRKYPNLILAQTKLGSSEYKSSGNNGFRTVANYIFGGNSKQQKIAMTAPVIMDMGDSASMSFVMPAEYEMDDLPKPASDQVQIRKQESKTLAVLRFGGYSDDEKIRKYAKRLEEVLLENNIKVKSALFYMGYNAPWDVVNRRNEVAFEVEFEH
jgi:hypothetical protein